jgi:N-acetyl sugar amidotransferase
MKYCKKCIQPDTRPGIYFNDEGICGACIYEEEKKKIDWHSREEELKGIVKWAKQKAKENNSNYDCVIGVSGGKDSTFQALYARDRLGLRALLVNSEPDYITEIGRKNIENLKFLGFDSIMLRPNPKVMKKLVKKDFLEYANPGKVTEMSLWSSAYIVADKFNIPLIIQGENPALTLGVTKIMEADGNALNVLQQDTLSTGWQRYVGDGISEEDLFMFRFDMESIKKKGIRGVWLQYYAKEWSVSGNAEFAISHGLTIRPEYFNPHEVGTYVPYSSLDSNLVPLNQMLKHIKFGFGLCTDYACYEIREGKITREEAIDLVKKYDGKCDIRYIKKFCDYIGISVDEFWRVANSFRGAMWEKKNENWVLKNPIWKQ